MIKHIILFLFLLGNMPSFAQFDNASESDPRAKAILKEIKSKFEKNDSFAASFTMNLHIPGQEDMIEKGELIQSGDLFNLSLASYLIISNEEKKWVYLRADNTANIYNSTSEESWVTPKDFLQIYDDTNFVYAMVPPEMVAEKGVDLIEFKSLDRNSEYSKMRLAINQGNQQIQSIKAFAKDGSRYELTINEIDYEPAIAASLFNFDTTKYPGVKVEDLRID